METKEWLTTTTILTILFLIIMKIAYVARSQNLPTISLYDQAACFEMWTQYPKELKDVMNSSIEDNQITTDEFDKIASLYYSLRIRDYKKTLIKTGYLK